MCKCSKLLIRYLDGECTASQKREIEEHLLMCRECAREQQSYFQLKAELESVSQIKAPKELIGMVFTRLSEEHRPFGKVDLWIEKRSRVELALLAFGLVVIFVAGVQVLNSLNANSNVFHQFTNLKSSLDHGIRTVTVLPQKLLTYL